MPEIVGQCLAFNAQTNDTALHMILRNAIYADYSARNIGYFCRLVNLVDTHFSDYFEKHSEVSSLVFMKFLHLYLNFKGLQDTHLEPWLRLCAELAGRLWAVHKGFFSLGRDLLRIGNEALKLPEFAYLQREFTQTSINVDVP